MAANNSKGIVIFLFLIVVSIGNAIPVSATEGQCLSEAATVFAALNAGKAAEAEFTAEMLLAKQRDCEPGWYALGKARAELGDWRGAAQAFMSADQIAPGNVNTLLRLAEALLAQQKPTWALRALQKIGDSGEPSQIARRDYLLGIASLQADDPYAARQYFEGIAETERRGLPLYAYYYAQALSLQKEADKAESQLARFVDDPQAEPLHREAALLQLDRLRSARIRQPLIGLSFGLSLLYDSNVLQQADDQPLANGATPASFGLELDGAFSVAPLRLAQHTLALDLHGMRTFYFENPADDFSPTMGTVTPRYEYRWSKDVHSVSLNVGYTGSVLTLDGGALAEETSFYVYNEQHSGWTRLDYLLEGFGTSSMRVQAGRALFHQRGRDNTHVKGQIGQSFFFLNERLKLFTQMLGRMEWARRDEYDRYGVGGFAGLSGLAGWKLNLALWLRYEFLDHLHSGLESTWAEQRRDHDLRIGTTISRPVLDWLTVGLSYDLTINRSTVDDFDYIRHVVMASLTARYSWSP